MHFTGQGLEKFYGIILSTFPSEVKFKKEWIGFTRLFHLVKISQYMLCETCPPIDSSYLGKLCQFPISLQVSTITVILLCHAIFTLKNLGHFWDDADFTVACYIHIKESGAVLGRG